MVRIKYITNKNAHIKMPGIEKTLIFTIAAVVTTSLMKSVTKVNTLEQ